MSGELRLCKDGKWRRKFKTTRRPKPKLKIDEELLDSSYGLPKCWYCGGPANTKDHQIPYSRGGRGRLNKVWACARCNCMKADRNVEEYRAFVSMLANQPVEKIIFYRERWRFLI